MNEIRNYPWRDKFKIPAENLEEWRQSSPKSSLTFYALKNRLINNKDYFDWAVDYYQTPKVDDMFFEQNLIKKEEWNQIKDTYDWTEEVLPVAFWNNTIFIGCVELNDKVSKKILGFDSRIVLVSPRSLEVTWSFFNTLSDIIEKTTTGFKTNHQVLTAQSGDSSKPAKDLQLKLKEEQPSDIKKDFLFAKKEGAVSSLKASKPSLLESEDKPDRTALKTEELKATFEPDLPSKKKIHPQPVLQPSSQDHFPEEERIRQTAGDETFPGRRPFPQEEEPFLVMQKKESAFEKNKELLVDSKKKAFELSSAKSMKSKTAQGLKVAGAATVASAKSAMSSLKSASKPVAMKIKNKIQELTLTNFKLEEKTKSNFSILTVTESNYKTLWDYTKKHYCSSMIFNVKEDKAYLDSFIGKVQIKSEDKKVSIDFKDYSLFKVVQRGHPYNGFVVDSPANKKFFNDLGWDKYPQYTTAIPIKGDSEKIKRIFVGFSLKAFSKQEMQNIQKDIIDIFQKRQISSAA